MVVVTFTDTDDNTMVHGPYPAVELLINELWLLDAKGDAYECLAEYDTHEGGWHVFGEDQRQFNLVTIASDDQP